ncbi:MAG: lipoyl(octanoyl) transferase LipB [Chromatiales bacterium]
MNVLVRALGRHDYLAVWDAMRQFTERRTADTPDEVWTLEHEPVYTLGLSGRTEHILGAGSLPVVHCDRGGQVTYHGPGQLVAYLLLDLTRLRMGVRSLVQRAEQSVIDVLIEYGLAGRRRAGAPGVYIGEAKIAALGFRIRRGCAYHGVAFNVDMDLEPFTRINPCGCPGLPVTQLRDFGIVDEVPAVAERWLPHLLRNLGLREQAATETREHLRLASL